MLPLSLKIEMEDGLNCHEPSDFDWFSTEDPDQGYVKVEFATPTPPSIAKVGAHASNESLMCDYCTFVQVVLSLPHIEGVDLDFDLGTEHDDNGSSDEPRY